MDDLCRYEPYARSLARRFWRPVGRAASDEQDVFQEAMIAAWIALGKWNEHGERDGYVKKQMKWRVIDYVRVRSEHAANSEVVSLDERAQNGPDMTLESVLDRERLRIVIDTVSSLPRLRRARLIEHGEGMPLAEIAAAQGCTLAAIDQSLWKARKAIKLALAA